MPAWVTSPVYDGLIETIIAARKSAGLTQRTLAARLGKPQSFVAKLETKERNLSLLEFVGLAQALAIDPAELLGRATRDLPARVEF